MLLLEVAIFPMRNSPIVFAYQFTDTRSEGKTDIVVKLGTKKQINVSVASINNYQEAQYSVHLEYHINNTQGKLYMKTISNQK